MAKTKLSILTTIIFFGAFWGFLEATLGHALQFMPSIISGLIMFPIAAVILIKAYKALGKKQYLVYIGFIAAAIKAVDFFLPGLPPAKTFNPMLAIILEAMVVAVAYSLFANRRQIKIALGAVITSVSWRLLFAIYMYASFMSSGKLAPYLATPGKAFSFIVISGALGGLLLMGLLAIDGMMTKKSIVVTTKRRIYTKPSFAVMMLIVALSAQYFI